MYKVACWGHPMHFYILNIEHLSDSSVLLYGRVLKDEVEDASTCESVPARVRVENIYSGILAKAVDGKLRDLEMDVQEFMDSKKTGYTVEAVRRQNLFYNNIDRETSLMKIVPKRSVSFESFFSDHAEAVITEFTNPVENIIVSRRLKGPCIVRIEKYSRPSDIVVRSPEDVSFVCSSEFPTMVFASLSMESSRTDILKYCLNVEERRYCGAVRSSYAAENLEAENMGFGLHTAPGALLNSLNAVLRKEAIDCFVYHNIPVSVLRKLDMGCKVKCDLFVFANGNIKGREFSIEEMASTLGLGIASELKTEFSLNKNYGDRCRMLCVEAQAILEIFQALDALQLSKEMSEVSGYILNRTFQNLRAERIEYTFLHELYEWEYLFPPAVSRREVKYTGGLVLTPAAGFYEDLVLLLDFNSLYPSIIQEFNVCFSTVGLSDRISGDIDESLLHRLTEQSRQAEQGILPKIIGGLVRRRTAVKNLIRQSRSQEEAKALDIRQKALKLTANSIYGCLGFAGSRFCNYAMAACITSKGRELLMEAKRIAEAEYGMKVIYGDTDSLMIHTGLPGVNSNYSRALEQAKGLKTAINAKYKNIEIEVDKVFKKLLLYKKKKYAGLCMDESGGTNVEYRGLDLVRKDFCGISTKTSEGLLELLLADSEDPETCRRFGVNGKAVPNNGNERIRDAVYDELIRTASGLQSVPLADFVIHNTLSKAPESYATAAGLPHVALALRLKEQGMKFEENDVVCYVVGKGDGKQPLHKRVFHPSEDFAVDYEYYVSHQILPPLFRIIKVVDSIHPQKICRIFGASENVRAEPQKTLSLLNPCCENAQEPSTHCKECSTAIPPSFYVSRVVEMLRREVESLYSVSLRCLACGVLSRSHLALCFGCGAELSFSAGNQDFDAFLNSLQTSFSALGISAVIEAIERHMAVSEYRKVDLTRYFGEEIARSLKNAG